MKPENALQAVAARFRYVPDDTNIWRIPEIRPGRDIPGDCEDFGLGVLWLVCNRNPVGFAWSLLTGRARFFSTYLPGGQTHAVLDYRFPSGQRYCTDNVQRKWVLAEHLWDAGYEYRKTRSGWWVLRAVVRGRFGMKP